MLKRGAPLPMPFRPLIDDQAPIHDIAVRQLRACRYCS